MEACRVSTFRCHEADWNSAAWGLSRWAAAVGARPDVWLRGSRFIRDAQDAVRRRHRQRELVKAPYVVGSLARIGTILPQVMPLLCR
jgi:hypothetical protein